MSSFHYQPAEDIEAVHDGAWLPARVERGPEVLTVVDSMIGEPLYLVSFSGAFQAWVRPQWIRRPKTARSI